MHSSAINRTQTDSAYSPIECHSQLGIGVERSTICSGISLPKRHWNADCGNTYILYFDALQALEHVAELQAASQATSGAYTLSPYNTCHMV